MSRRNFILLIIVLVIAVAVIFGFLFFREPTTNTGEDTGGTNFLSIFNPFASPPPPAPPATPPVNTPSPEPTPEEMLAVKLKKVSSMPVAGYGVYQKERLKE